MLFSFYVLPQLSATVHPMSVISLTGIAPNQLAFAFGTKIRPEYFQTVQIRFTATQAKIFAHF
jgi:hypothetical protein